MRRLSILLLLLCASAWAQHASQPGGTSVAATPTGLAASINTSTNTVTITAGSVRIGSTPYDLLQGTAASPTGAGNVYFYVTSAGLLTAGKGAGISSSGTLTNVTDGGDVLTPFWPASSIPVAVCTVASSNYGTCTDKRASLSGGVALDGSGNLSVGTTLPAGAPTGTIAASVIYSPNGALNVKAFGAIGNGTTDDTAAIQAALDSGGSIYLPKGTYKVSTSLKVKLGSIVFGDGGNDVAQTTLTTASPIPVFSLVNDITTYGTSLSLRDLAIDCASTASSSGILIGSTSNLVFSPYVFLDSVRVGHCGTGIAVKNVFVLHMNRLLLKQNLGNGLDINPHNYTTTVYLDNSDVAANGGYGISITSSSAQNYNMVIDHSAIEGNAGSQITAHAINLLSVDHSYLEASDNIVDGITLDGDGNAQNVQIRDTIFENGRYSIYATSPMVSLKVDNAVSQGSTEFIHLTGASKNVTVMNSKSDSANSFGSTKVFEANNDFPDQRYVNGISPSVTSLPSPGTSITLTAPRGYALCTGTCTVTLPVPSAGYEFCILNDDNVATGITLAALGSSAMYENSARTAYGTAGTGTLVMAPAAGNKVCLIGRDSTHYITVSSAGGAITVN